MTLGSSREGSEKGFSLVENLISLVVVAFVAPTVLSALMLSLTTKQQATHETRARQVAQHVFLELPYVWRDESSVMFPRSRGAGIPSFPELNSTGTPLAILFGADALLLQDWQVAQPDFPQSGNPDVTGGYLAIVTQVDGSSLGYNQSYLRRFEVRVEFPAGQPAESRQSHTYARLFRHP